MFKITIHLINSLILKKVTDTESSVTINDKIMDENNNSEKSHHIKIQHK